MVDVVVADVTADAGDDALIIDIVVDVAIGNIAVVSSF